MYHVKQLLKMSCEYKCCFSFVKAHSIIYDLGSFFFLLAVKLLRLEQNAKIFRVTRKAELY